MKPRIKLFLLALLLALVAFTCAQAAVNEEKAAQMPASVLVKYTSLPEVKTAAVPAETKPSFKLPASLQVIEDRAFEGTAIVSVEIPESVAYIGDYAFADISSLLGVQIPDTTTYIGKNAFAGSKQVTLTASSGSYARSWAKENGIRFRLLATFTAKEDVFTVSIRKDDGHQQLRKERLEKTDDQFANVRERRTGRTVGELKAAQYKGIAALYIQSRYFP